MCVVGGGVSSLGCWAESILMEGMASWRAVSICCLSCELSLALVLA